MILEIAAQRAVRGEERPQLGRVVGSVTAHVRHPAFGTHAPRHLGQALGVRTQHGLELAQVGLPHFRRARLPVVRWARRLGLPRGLGRGGRFAAERHLGRLRGFRRPVGVEASRTDDEAGQRDPHDDGPQRQPTGERGQGAPPGRAPGARRGPLEPSPVSTRQH